MKYRSAVARGALALAAIAVSTPLLATSSFASGPSAPATPTNVVLASGNKVITVTWNESSTGVIKFVATATAPGKPTRSCPATRLLDCKIASLQNGVVYGVTVVAKNLTGNSAPSGLQTVMVGVPSAPLSVNATALVAAAQISWAPPIASGVNPVVAYMATAQPGGFSCSTSGTLLTPAARTCEIAGLTSGATYTVTVTATNSFGTGLPSRTATVKAN